MLAGARQLVPGEPGLEVLLIASNPGDRPVDTVLPERLSARIRTGSHSEPLLLRAAAAEGEAPVTLAPGSTTQRLYRGLLPERANGFATLRVDEPPAGSIVLSVAAAQDRAGPRSWGDSPDSDRDLLDRILDGLATYEPVYFVVGGDLTPVTAKFQLSAQYRILLEPRQRSDGTGFWRAVWREAHKLYAGYTQTSVWELDSPSAPFRDTTFRPALYYLDHHFLDGLDLPWDRFGLQLGLEHESNGQEGDDSRSLNIFFVRPILTFDLGERYHFTLAPKAYAYLEKSDNRDIDDYRGYVDLLLKLGRVDGAELAATLRKGSRKAYGSAQLDLTYPIARITRHFGAFLQAQLFYGYGDTLLDYDRNADVQLRGGLALVPYGAFVP